MLHLNASKSSLPVDEASCGDFVTGERVGDIHCIQRRYLKHVPLSLYEVLDTGDSKLGGHDYDEHVTSYFHAE